MDLQKLIDNLGGWPNITPFLIGLAVIIGSYFVATLLAQLTERVVRRRGSPHAAAIANKLVFYAFFTGALLITLSHLGLKLSGLLAAAGILTVAIGFAAQTSVSNVISGIFLYFDRPFSIDDTVRIGEVLGTVTSIDLLSTRIRTFDNLMVRLPNETLLKSTIINFTLFPIRRIEIPVAVAYGSDLDECREILLSAIAKHPNIMDEPAPFVIVDSLEDGLVNLKIRAWIERSEYVRARSALTQTIYEALQEAQIAIPWPQRIIQVRHPDDLAKLSTPKPPETAHRAEKLPQ